MARRRVETRACAVQTGSAHRRTTFGGLGNVAETADLEAAVGALRLTAEVEASSSSSSSSRTVATGVATAPFAHLTEGTELRVFVEVCSANRETMRSVKGSRERYDGAYDALDHRVRQTFGEDAARVAVLRNPPPSALPRPLARRLPSEWGGGKGGRSADVVGPNPFRLARAKSAAALRGAGAGVAPRGSGSYPRLGAFEVGYALLLGGRLAGHGMVGSKLVSGLFPNTSRMGTELIRCVQDDLARDHSRREAEAATALRRMQSERQEAEEAAVKAAEAAAEVQALGEAVAEKAAAAAAMAAGAEKEAAEAALVVERKSLAAAEAAAEAALEDAHLEAQEAAEYTLANERRDADDAMAEALQLDAAAEQARAAAEALLRDAARLAAAAAARGGSETFLEMAASRMAEARAAEAKARDAELDAKRAVRAALLEESEAQAVEVQKEEADVTLAAFRVQRLWRHCTSRVGRVPASLSKQMEQMSPSPSLPSSLVVSPAGFGAFFTNFCFTFFSKSPFFCPDASSAEKSDSV